MSVKRFHQKLLIATLSFGLIAPAMANDAEDPLGQFLKNIPTEDVAENDEDPIRTIIANQQQAQSVQVNSKLVDGSNVMPAVAQQQYNFVTQQYDFVNKTRNVSNTASDAVPYDSASSYYAPLLNARSALIMNANTGKILYQKNMDSVRPIASISKLMSAMVLLDAKLNMNEEITITTDEIDRLKGTSSRLSVGTTLTRGELLHLGLMSSENRAIHALGRTYPGGMSAFVSAMNAKAQSLGMSRSRFYEPTGLDPRNVSTARDLSVMVRAANKYPQIRSLSTSNYGEVYTSAGKTQTFKNTNSLVREGAWDISLQKTGYIKEAGRSMVLQAQMGKDPVVIVVLGSSTSSSRVNDARALSTMVYQTPL